MTMQERLIDIIYGQIGAEYTRDSAECIVDLLLTEMENASEEMVIHAQDQYAADLNGVGRVIIGCVYMSMIQAIREGK